MSIVAMELASLSNALSTSLAERAKEILAKIILPEKISGSIVEKYIRKAMRLGVWRRLPLETRALLCILRKWKSIRSPILTSILHGIFLEIELCTLRGKALFYGIILALKNPLNKLLELLRKPVQLLVAGLSYLNNPPIYRVHG